MSIGRAFITMISWMIFIPGMIISQEEGSADVFTEDYTDEFQENFFEALKQKGIENYDKAIQLFLVCKKLDEGNPVVDFELANTYLEDNQLMLAQDYAIAALRTTPGNLWYLNTLVDIMRRQGSSVEAVREKLPYNEVKLKENLALIYFRSKNYENALGVLKEMGHSIFSTELTGKIKDSLAQEGEKQVRAETTPLEAPDNPIETYSSRIASLIGAGDFDSLEEVAAEALENFPSIPYFYYAYGLALSRNSKPQLAVIQLESSLDYLLDDEELAKTIYRELAGAYKTLGNTSKANMYLSKLKSGS